jgi:hypothetical protein
MRAALRSRRPADDGRLELINLRSEATGRPFDNGMWAMRALASYWIVEESWKRTPRRPSRWFAGFPVHATSGESSNSPYSGKDCIDDRGEGGQRPKLGHLSLGRSMRGLLSSIMHLRGASQRPAVRNFERLTASGMRRPTLLELRGVELHEVPHVHRCFAGELLHGIRHAIVTPLPSQFGHGREMPDEVLRKPRLPEAFAPRREWDIAISDGPAERLGEDARIVVPSRPIPARSDRRFVRYAVRGRRASPLLHAPRRPQRSARSCRRPTAAPSRRRPARRGRREHSNFCRQLAAGVSCGVFQETGGDSHRCRTIADNAQPRQTRRFRDSNVSICCRRHCQDSDRLCDCIHADAGFCSGAFRGYAGYFRPRQRAV